MKRYIESVDNCWGCPNREPGSNYCFEIEKVLTNKEMAEFPNECPLEDY